MMGEIDLFSNIKDSIWIVIELELFQNLKNGTVHDLEPENRFADHCV